MRKRSMFLALAVLAIGMSAAGGGVASAAKPTPSFSEVETIAYPDGEDCVVYGRSFTENARWVSHTLTVNSVAVGPEVVRVTGDEVAELMLVIKEGANTDVLVDYDTYILWTDEWPTTEYVDDGSLRPQWLSCVAPALTPSLHPSAEPAGRYWNALALAIAYPEQDELWGVWVVEGQDDLDPQKFDPGQIAPIGVDAVEFRYDGISKKTDSVTFELWRGHPEDPSSKNFGDPIKIP